MALNRMTRKEALARYAPGHLASSANHLCAEASRLRFEARLSHLDDRCALSKEYSRRAAFLESRARSLVPVMGF